MTLFRLKSAPIIVIEDDQNINILPLLLELTAQKNLNIFCYEQPITLWKHVFREKVNVSYHVDFDPKSYDKYAREKSTIVIDSINQMALCLGWDVSLKYLKKLHTDANIAQLILVLHKDCLSPSSVLPLHLNYLTSATVSYDSTNPCKIHVQLKKGGKIIQSDELLTYDHKTSTLKCTQLVKEDKVEDEPDKILPSQLSTFKIEVEQTEKIEKYKLKLPYMNKIHEGESKVYYEPDAVDDWDEEDPDEDLDI